MTKIIFDKLPPGAVMGDELIDSQQAQIAEQAEIIQNLRAQVARQLTQILRLKGQLDKLAAGEIE